MPSVIPTGDPSAYVPPPGSITWRRAGDARLYLSAGYALLLQVSHPVVGAGVGEHSNYRQDPWGRLLRTLDFVNVMVYGGGDAAAEMGRRVRGMHRRIKGVRPDGERYHALEPEAYAWVHATLADSIVSGHERFGRPLSRAEKERFWDEWRRLGRLVGVRERDLPAGWDGFRDYFDGTVATVLEDNRVVHDVLETLVEPMPPPVVRLPAPAWRAARIPVARIFRLATVGMLPPLLRDRLGLRFGRADELELRALGRAARAATAVMPDGLRTMGPMYLRWRGSETRAWGGDERADAAA